MVKLEKREMGEPPSTLISVNEVVKKGYWAEADRKKMLEKEGWIVFRVSGSIGAMDLIAIKPFTSTLYEVRLEQVKSVRSNTYYFDERAKDEWRRLYEFKKSGIICKFVILFKVKGRRVWKEFKLTSENPPKKLSYY